MNKGIITASAAALVAIIAVSGFAFSSFAADEATGERTWGQGFGFHKELTDEQISEKEAYREEMEANRETRRTEMQEAIDAGYDTWTAYVTRERGEDAQILEVITAGNFDEFVSAHNKIQSGQELVEEGRQDMEDLGIEHMGMGAGKGFKKGFGMGMKRGMHMQ